MTGEPKFIEEMEAAVSAAAEKAGLTSHQEVLAIGLVTGALAALLSGKPMQEVIDHLDASTVHAHDIQEQLGQPRRREIF
jgi:hypothetical protein